MQQGRPPLRRRIWPVRLIWWVLRLPLRVARATLLYGPALFLLAYTGAYFTQFSGPALGRFISARVNHVKRGTFQLGSVDYSYWGGMASILFNTPVTAYGRDFTEHDPDGNLVLQVPVAETQIHLRELIVSLVKYASHPKAFSLTLHFKRAHVPEAFAVVGHLRSSLLGQSPTGKPEINIVSSFAAKKPSPPSGGEFKIVLEELVVDRLRFGLVMHETGPAPPPKKLLFSTRIDEGRARAGLVYSSRHDLESHDGPYFFFQVGPLEAASGALTIGGQTIALSELRVAEFGSREPRRQDVAFSATARSLGARVSARGAMIDVYSQKPGVKLTLGFEDGRELPSLLPRPLSQWLGGSPRGQIKVEGPFSAVRIDGTIEDAEAKVEGIAVTRLATKLAFADGRLELDPTTGNTLGGSARAAIEIELPRAADPVNRKKARPGWWRTKVALRGVDPGGVALLSPSLQRVLKGRLDGTVRVAGSLGKGSDTIEVSAIDAVLERQGGGRLPRRIELGGALDVSPRDVTLKEVRAAGSGASVVATGTVTPKDGRVDARVVFDGLHGGRWIEDLGVPRGLVIGAAHAEARVGGTVREPNVDGQLVGKGLLVAGRPVERIEAQLGLSAGKLRLHGLRGDGPWKELRGEAELGLTGAAPTIHAELVGRDLDMQRAMLRSDVEGTADFSLLVDGPLKDPVGRLEVALAKFAWQGDPYERGALRVELGGGGARLSELRLERKNGGGLSGTGRVGWDGGLDLALKLRNFPLVAVPSLRALPVALGGTISGDATLAGDTEHPLVGGILSLFGFKVRETLLGDGSVKLVPGGDAIQISGKLFGNVEVDGYLTLFPKFTVTANVRFRDLEIERLIPEVKKIAELEGRATGTARVTFDGENGLTYAGLRIEKLELVVRSQDEAGHVQKETVRNEEDVLLSTDGKVLRFERAHLTSTVGDFYLEGQVGAKKTDVRVNGRVDLVFLEYFFRGAFDHTHGRARLDLRIAGDLERPELDGWVDLSNAVLVPRGISERLLVPVGRIQFARDAVKLASLAVTLDGQTLRAEGTVKLDRWKPRDISGQLRGDLSPRLFQMVFKEHLAEANGKIAIELRAGGTWDRPQLTGVADVKGVSGRLRRLPYEIFIEQGTIRLDGTRLAIGCPRSGAPSGCRRLVGRLDDHRAVLNGRVELGSGFSLRGVEVAVEGSEWEYRTPEWGVTFSPDLVFFGDGQKLSVRGRVDLNDGTYRQNYDFLGVVLKAQRTAERDPPFWEGVPLLENLQLDVHAESSGQLQVKNNLAQITMSARLDIGGTLAEPTVDGQIDLDEGGAFTPPIRVPFVTQRGSVTFDGKKSIPNETPTLNIGATAQITDAATQRVVRIDLLIAGTVVAPVLQLSSSEGWDQATTLSYLGFGISPQQVRQQIGVGAPDQARFGTGYGTTSAGTSAGDNATKVLTGMAVGMAIADPLQRVLRLDSLSVQFGTSSFDLNACKELGRFFRGCGRGQFGFSGNYRIEVDFRFRWTDIVGTEAGLLYLTGRNIETIEDTKTRLRLDIFKLQFQLGH
jgi:autotransporter translocation and assembly factor TamB